MSLLCTARKGATDGALAGPKDKEEVAAGASAARQSGRLVIETIKGTGGRQSPMTEPEYDSVGEVKES